jgi:cytochrome b subunit of formate dehydrogenase
MWRFSPIERGLHIVVIISFFGLVITGTPLLFSHTAWAVFLMNIMGGYQVAGVIHRFCAILTFGYFFVHVGHLFYRIARSDDKLSYFWGPDSMVAQPKDLTDMIQSFKWFFGKAERPQFDRFSYMDKLDYWGEIWGVGVIGGSGLLLWFPEFFSMILPGWAFNVASIIHGIEALLASGVIFTIHFFNVNLRPEKFPIDVVMFTGRGTAEYMKEEHPLEYDRLVQTGRWEERLAPPPSRATYLWSVSLGLVGLSIGLLLIGLILWALLFGA